MERALDSVVRQGCWTWTTTSLRWFNHRALIDANGSDVWTY